MDLDDFKSFSHLDPHNILPLIDGLPGQLEAAWELGSKLPLNSGGGIQRVLLAGMGSAGDGAELLAAYAGAACPVPVVVHRDYRLPSWAQGSQTLVIASSFSGDSEETISAFKQAAGSGCRCLAITTGGALVEAASAAGAERWIYEYPGPAFTAIGYSFGLPLAALTRLGLLSDPSAELARATAAMRLQQETLRAEVPVVGNPAKRIAGQLMGRWVVFFGTEILAPVARRWKNQVNELAKTWGQFDLLPDADHNTLAGLLQPEDLLGHSMALFLRSPSEHPRNRIRSDLTRRALMLEGLNTDFIDAQGEDSLAHQWTALHYGDYVAYYLAMAYEIDPAPGEGIEAFKQDLG